MDHRGWVGWWSGWWRLTAGYGGVGDVGECGAGKGIGGRCRRPADARVLVFISKAGARMEYVDSGSPVFLVHRAFE